MRCVQVNHAMPHAKSRRELKIGHTKLYESEKEGKFAAQRRWSSITATQQLQQHQLSFEPNKCIARGIKYESNINESQWTGRKANAEERERQREIEREEVYNEKSINLRFFLLLRSHCSQMVLVRLLLLLVLLFMFLSCVFRSESFHLIRWYVQRSLNEVRFVEHTKSRQQQHRTFKIKKLRRTR